MKAAERKAAERRSALEAAGALARHAMNERDELIAAALAAGMPQREVARLVGLSHTAVQNIARRRSS